MKPGACACPPRQAGNSLPLLMASGLLLTGVWLAATPPPGSLQRAEAEQRALSAAREALIARAATDDNRPGSLPCPDLITDDTGLRNHPDDGKADHLTRNRCPSDLGRLPWATLALPPQLDRAGQRLWYVIAPGLYDDDNAEPINSDTSTGLQVDSQHDIAALLLAPGPALPAQRRPSSRPADHLEGENGNGDDRRYSLNTPDSNDRVITITRGELMAAVETRIAAQVQACLLAHAQMRDFPWPAPLAATAGRGHAGSRFGRIPRSQPEAAPGSTLDESLASLSQSQQALEQPADDARRLEQHRQRQSLASTLRQVARATFESAARVSRNARSLREYGETLNSQITQASANLRISRLEGAAITAAYQAGLPNLEALSAALLDSGLDPWGARLALELQQLRSDLPTLSPPERGQRSCALQERIGLTHGGHAELRDALQALGTVTAAACNPPTTGAPGDTELGLALDQLLAAISAGRGEILAADLLMRATNWESHGDDAGEAALTEALLSRWQHGPRHLLGMRDQTRLALQAGDRTQGIALLRQLASALADWERLEHNLSRSTLLGWQARLGAEHAAFHAQDQASPRPLQQAITPYAQTLAASTRQWLQVASDIERWAEQLAMRAHGPTGDATTPPLADSLLVQAERQQALENDALAARQTALRQGSRSSQLRAEQTLSAARLAGEDLLNAGRHLQAALSPPFGSGPAAAWPISWRALACDFLHDPPDAPSWWWRNRWQDTLFYQIGDRSPRARPRLQIDGRPPQSVVVLAAGAALPGQQRSRQRIADFLEGPNADPGREGFALAPGPFFSRRPRSTTENDVIPPSLLLPQVSETRFPG